jgi:hypothetical protein
MKARRTRNIMLAVVALIWGLVIWRFVSGGSDKGGSAFQQDVLSIPELGELAEADTFSLQLNYRDPFLGGLKPKVRETAPDPQPAVQAVALVKPPSTPKVVEPPIWSHFRYHGEVKDSKSGRRTGLLTADGRMMYVDEGMSYTGFQVLTIWPDSIRLKTDKETFTLNL